MDQISTVAHSKHSMRESAFLCCRQTAIGRQACNSGYLENYASYCVHLSSVFVLFFPLGGGEGVSREEAPRTHKKKSDYGSVI